MPTFDTYYSLLDMSPDLPSWAHPKKLASAHTHYTELYGEDLPEPAATAFLVCGQEQARADYDRLLELASVGPVQLDAEELKRLEQVAEITHFTRDRRSDGLAHFRPQPLVLPDPAKVVDVEGAATDSSEAASEPKAAEPSPVPQASKPDEWGLIDGYMPRIRVGNYVFRMEYITGYILEASTELDTHVLQSFKRPEDGRRFEIRDYNAHMWNRGCRPVGVPYYFIELVSDADNQRYLAGYGSLEGDGMPYVASTGVFNFFPLHLRKDLSRGDKNPQAEWSKHYPGRPVPRDGMFDRSGGWTRYTKKVFADYVAEIFYWTRLQRRGRDEPDQAAIRKTAREMTSQMFLYYGSFPRKELPKMGLPTIDHYKPPKRKKLFGLF